MRIGASGLVIMQNGSLSQQLNNISLISAILILLLLLMLIKNGSNSLNIVAYACLLGDPLSNDGNGVECRGAVVDCKAGDGDAGDAGGDAGNTGDIGCDGGVGGMYSSTASSTISSSSSFSTPLGSWFGR